MVHSTQAQAEGGLVNVMLLGHRYVTRLREYATRSLSTANMRLSGIQVEYDIKAEVAWRFQRWLYAQHLRPSASGDGLLSVSHCAPYWGKWSGLRPSKWGCWRNTSTCQRPVTWLRLSCVCDTAPGLAFSLVRDSAWRPGDKHGTAAHTASKPLFASSLWTELQLMWRLLARLCPSKRSRHFRVLLSIRTITFELSQYSIHRPQHLQFIFLLLTHSVLNAACCYCYLLCDVFKNHRISREELTQELQTILRNTYMEIMRQVNNVFLFQHLT